MNPKAELTESWRNAGIEPGDTVMLHTSCKRTFQRFAERGKPIEVSDIFESFLDAVGPRGTVLFPTYNFGFCEGKPYDIRRTPSQMGVLTEFARTTPGAVRNGHPVYSFASVGYKAYRFEIDNYSGLGKRSPFDILTQMGGKVASLDMTDQHSVTYYHYIEDVMKVPYRFSKEFQGLYTDAEGYTRLRTYEIYVRRRSEGVVTTQDPMMRRLWAGGVYSGWHPGVGPGLRVATCKDMYNFIAKYIDTDLARYYLYRIDESAVEDD